MVMVMVMVVLHRSALLMSIDNENLEMVELLLDNKVSQLYFSRLILRGNCNNE